MRCSLSQRIFAINVYLIKINIDNKKCTFQRFQWIYILFETTLWKELILLCCISNWIYFPPCFNNSFPKWFYTIYTMKNGSVSCTYLYGGCYLRPEGVIFQCICYQKTVLSFAINLVIEFCNQDEKSNKILLG